MDLETVKDSSIVENQSEHINHTPMTSNPNTTTSAS
jgi:hypothetical protein